MTDGPADPIASVMEVLNEKVVAVSALEAVAEDAGSEIMKLRYREARSKLIEAALLKERAAMIDERQGLHETVQQLATERDDLQAEVAALKQQLTDARA